VRFEFARRAHQRESTPSLGINREYSDVKEKERKLGHCDARTEEKRKKFKSGTVPQHKSLQASETRSGCVLRGAEEHMGRLEVLALALVDVENKVVLGDEVAGMETEKPGGLINGLRRALQLDEDADGCFVIIDEKILGPSVAGGKFVGGAELLVAEPAAKAETFEDFLQGFGFGEDRFEFFADFVAAVRGRSSGTDRELFGRGLEGQQITLGVFGGRLLPFCGSGGRFRADSEQLTVFGEASVWRVEEQIEFVDAGGDRLGAELSESAQKGFWIRDAELDFDLGWHGGGKNSRDLRGRARWAEIGRTTGTVYKSGSAGVAEAALRIQNDGKFG
jgi:hypothetical protein